MYVLEFGEGDGQRKYACEFCSYSSAFKANVKGGKSDGRNAVFRIRIGSGFNEISGFGYGFGIRTRIQEGKNDPLNKIKIQNPVLKCGMFSFEGLRLLL
jgi:hypothetical protein